MRLLSSGGGDTGVIVGTGGAVGFAGVLPGDSTLFINSTTGVSKPILGSATDPTMDLNSINVRISPETKTDVLTILLSDTNFGPSGRGSLEADIGGTLDAGMSLTARAFKDPTNTEFGMSGTVVTLGPFTNPTTKTQPFAAAGSAPHGALSFPYSMTQAVIITFPPSSSTLTVSFDFHIHNAAAPEPSSMALAGLGALGLIAYGLRRRKAMGA
jgi:hypothetical protein